MMRCSILIPSPPFPFIIFYACASLQSLLLLIQGIPCFPQQSEGIITSSYLNSCISSASSLNQVLHIQFIGRWANPRGNSPKGNEQGTWGGTQLRVPDTTTLRDAFENYKEKPGDLPNIIKNVILNMGFEGKGFMNVLYKFAAPITGALVKKGFFPDFVSNNVFIPVITSASVLVLATLNKI
ncbi:uncharacterized protein LOC131251295 [Magnolia sinica]|uniref:uncharacterized protein LOC131251295 n=1 Tax=Magnolia sinica TaxID=86752 RepID=UPI0026599D0E|nr:uncharacterized protein LOC131251295 [Magnolia sinica]